MALCQLQGRPDMYGLGIRMAVYTQWFGAVLIGHISHINESAIPSIRILGLLLSAALALSLVIQVVQKTLQAVDIYITLLLATGIYIPLVPVYLLRVLTLCHPSFDPLCWAAEPRAPVAAIGNVGLAAMVASLGVWCYTTFLPAVQGGCMQYAFFFARVPLLSNTFAAFNAILYICMIIACACTGLRAMGFKLRTWRRARRRARRSRHSLDNTWRLLCTLSNATIAPILVAAVELTIKWNKIRGIGNIDTTAQMAPLFLSVVTVLRAVFDSYKCLKESETQDSPPQSEVRGHVPPPPYPSTSSSSSSSPSRKTRSVGRGPFASGALQDDGSVSLPSRVRTT